LGGRVLQSGLGEGGGVVLGVGEGLTHTAATKIVKENTKHLNMKLGRGEPRNWCSGKELMVRPPNTSGGGTLGRGRAP